MSSFGRSLVGLVLKIGWNGSRVSRQGQVKKPKATVAPSTTERIKQPVPPGPGHNVDSVRSDRESLGMDVKRSGPPALWPKRKRTRTRFGSFPWPLVGSRSFLAEDPCSNGMQLCRTVGHDLGLGLGF